MHKKLINLFFAITLLFSSAVIPEITSTQNPHSVQAQTQTVKKKRVGPIRKVYRGGKFVGVKVWRGTRWVGVKTYKGSKYIGKKTWKGTKWTGKKIKDILY